MAGLRVATYNLYLGADLSLVFGATDEVDLARRAREVHRQALATDFPARAEAIATLLVRERVDVVGLQEVARWSRVPLRGTARTPETWCDFLAELGDALDNAGARYTPYAANASFAGTAAVSEEEAVHVAGHNVTLVRQGSDVEVTGWRTGSFRAALEIEAPMPGLTFHVPRSWGWVDATVGGSRFRLANTHTEAYDAGVRDAQRDELLRLVEWPRLPLVVVGDLNAEPVSVGMPPSYSDAWVAAGEGPGYTCGQAPDLANAESSLHKRIDYVWVRDAAVTGCRVVGDRPADRTKAAGLWPSDHACVVADVVF